MIQLTRRTVLAGTAAAMAVSSKSEAAAPPSGKQVPGFYRYKVGSFECTAVNDGALTFPMPDGFVTNVSKEQALAAAEAAYFPRGMVTIPFTPQLINTGSKLVLIDTGWGPGVGPTVGLLSANLQAAGIDPNAIDIIIISHLHPDHTNGIRNAEGGFSFPNAEIKVPSRDWEFWMSDGNMARAPNDVMKDYFVNARRVYAGIAERVTMYDRGQEVGPGITAIDAAGHSPGHTAFAVASGSQRILIQSDITIIPDLFLRYPDWHIAFDVDPIKAAEIRHKFHDMAAAEKSIVIGFHFPFPTIGHIEKSGTGYRLVPIAWSPTM
jgi:glyoxylase-like metal-dependent hydrolase (beta-lactamase superfamily II)